MRIALFFFLMCPWLPAQTAPPTSSGIDTQTQTLVSHLYGHWAGLLEYLDYSEPAGSTKRVQLPTWLFIQPALEGASFDYTYDDGPTKTVTSHNTLVADLDRSALRILSTDSAEEVLHITDSSRLKNGYGELVLEGAVEENHKPAALRRTWTIRRNLITWLDETKPLGSSQEFAFRHSYTLVRAEAPAPIASSK